MGVGRWQQEQQHQQQLGDSQKKGDFNKKSDTASGAGAPDADKPLEKLNENVNMDAVSKDAEKKGTEKMDTSETTPLLADKDQKGTEGSQMTDKSASGAAGVGDSGYKAVGSAAEVPTLDPSAGSKRGAEHIVGDQDTKRNVAPKAGSAEKPTAA